MKNIKPTIVILIFVICMSVIQENILFAARTISFDEITAKHVEEYKERMLEPSKIFTIHLSNIIYDVNGKEVRIPIFKGNLGDVYYRDLWDYFQNKTSMENIGSSEVGFLIKTKKGEMKKTFHEFLAFYKSNILKDVDIEHPVTIYLSPVEWIIQYNFVVDGVPCYMHINFESRKEDTGKPLPKSVYDIVPNENAGNPGIFFQFYRGRSVPAAK